MSKARVQAALKAEYAPAKVKSARWRVKGKKLIWSYDEEERRGEVSEGRRELGQSFPRGILGKSG